MTTERFRDELDRLDSGLSDHPDTAAYMREGRAARRRRHGVIGLGAGALVAAAVTPVFVWGGGTATSGPTSDVASDPTSSASPEPTPTPTSQPSPMGPVDRSFGDGMTAAVTEMFPVAEFREEVLGDHYANASRGNFHFVEPKLSSPPDWANVFTWTQNYTMEGLQSFSVRAEWNKTSGFPCHDETFSVTKDCSTTESNGHTVVVHDGVRVQGEPVGDWTRVVTVVSPPSADGGTQHAEVWAQVGGMTWAEASEALPSAADMAALAQDERLRLPEPTEIPTP